MAGANERDEWIRVSADDRSPQQQTGQVQNRAAAAPPQAQPQANPPPRYETPTPRVEPTPTESPDQQSPGLKGSGTVDGVTGSILEPDNVERGKSSSRKVTGDFTLKAQAVIVASGGIGGNHDLVRQHWPMRLGEPPKNMISVTRNTHIPKVAVSFCCAIESK